MSPDAGVHNREIAGGHPIEQSFFDLKSGGDIVNQAEVIGGFELQIHHWGEVCRCLPSCDTEYFFFEESSSTRAPVPHPARRKRTQKEFCVAKSMGKRSFVHIPLTHRGEVLTELFPPSGGSLRSSVLSSLHVDITRPCLTGKMWERGSFGLLHEFQALRLEPNRMLGRFIIASCYFSVFIGAPLEDAVLARMKWVIDVLPIDGSQSNVCSRRPEILT